jgi:hypothetical protein
MSALPVTPEDVNMAACAARSFLKDGSAPNNKTLAAQLSRALLHILDNRADPRRQFMTPEIMTASGQYFDFENPETFDWNIEDIAQGLSNQCRFTGQVLAFYSTAQHSCHASDMAPEAHKFEALMHDAHEAVVGDMATPMKILCPDYRIVEDRAEAAMRARYDLPAKMSPEVKRIDLIMLGWEKDHLMPSTEGHAQWGLLQGVPKIKGILTPWPAEHAKLEFMERFRRLLPLHLARVAREQAAAAKAEGSVSFKGVFS